MLFSPEMELFNYFYAECDEKFDTYDYLPIESQNAPYPFVIIGNTQLVPDGTKSALNGDISQRIDVWNMANDRVTTNNIINEIYKTALNLKGTEHYRFSFNKQRSETQMVTDTSVQSVVLLHGILDLHLTIL